LDKANNRERANMASDFSAIATIIAILLGIYILIDHRLNRPRRALLQTPNKDDGTSTSKVTKPRLESVPVNQLGLREVGPVPEDCKLE
jgi:hypothetical protein